MLLIGGADQGEIGLVGDREDDPPVGALEEVALVVIVELARHDMAAAHEADLLGRVLPGDVLMMSPTHGPPALTSARAVISSARAVALDRHAPEVAVPRGADTRVRTMIRAPRASASRAFSTTRRESSTQQSEYS
jgi:DNA-directed RNA polymerase subunit K/omega